MMADGGRRSPQPDKLASIALPLGWESKYDFAQKRYFFIDHKTKTTTWEDPRIKLLEKQQQHTAGHRGGDSQNLLPKTEDYRSACASPTSLKTGGTPTKSASGGWQSQIEDKYGMKVEIIRDDTDIDPEVLRRVTSRFPTVGKELVTMVMTDCSSEEAVYQKLREMGYKEHKPISGSDSQPRSTSSSPSHQDKAPTAATSSKFAAALPAFGSKSINIQPASPGHKLEPSGKPSIPDLKRASPDKPVAPKNIMSNPTDKRGVSPGRLSKEKGSGHRSHHSNKASPLAELSHDKKKKLREKLEHDYKNLERSVIESTLLSCAYDEVKARLALNLLLVAETFSASVGHAEDAANGQGSVMNKISADSVTPVSSISGERINALAKAFSGSSSDPSGYTSVLRQEPKGPDSSLAKGPNKQLLLSDYVIDTGSQSSYCHGPCKENYNGPCAEFQRGPEAGLAKGPASMSHVSSSNGSAISVTGRE